MRLTRSAVERLKTIILEHPEETIVRIQVKDLDEQRLAFSITLQDRVQPEDQAETIDDLTVAVPAASALRLDGIILDYQEASGFKFHHIDQQSDLRLDFIKPN